MSFKSLIKAGMFWGVSKTKAYRLFEPLLGGIGVILMFHRVLPEGRMSRFAMNRSIEVTSDTLEKVVNLFKRLEFDFVGLEECRKRILEEKKGKRRCVVFTFDDGYRDNYECAYPVLRKHEIPFVLYVASNFPNRKMATWWYALEDLIISRKNVSFHHNEREYNFPCKTVDEMHAAFAAIHHMILLSESKAVHHQLMEDVFHDWDGDLCNCSGALPMNWEHVVEMSHDELVEIGAHTKSHAPLTCQSDADSRFEILQSKKDLEAKIGKPVMHFAYPYGMHGKRERDTVKELGFSTATTTWPGNLHQTHAACLNSLPRVAITDDFLKGDYLNLMISGFRPFVENSFSKAMRFR